MKICNVFLQNCFSDIFLTWTTNVTDWTCSPKDQSNNSVTKVELYLLIKVLKLASQQFGSRK